MTSSPRRGPQGRLRTARRTAASTRGARRAGFTLIELLVATAAMAFVLVYSLGTFTANRNAYVVIENVSEAHQNIMAIASMIERDLRNAGYAVPAEAAACGVDSTTAPDMLFVSDADAIRTADNLPAALAGERLSASRTVGLPPGAVTVDDVVIDDDPTYDVDGTPGAESDFREDAGYIMVDLDDPTRVHCGFVTTVNAGANQITVTSETPAPAGAGNWVVVPAHVYRINGGALERDGVVMARNVEDFQLAWFYDLDDDGQVDANEDFGSGGGEPDLDNPGWATIPDTALLREVRFNLVLRTADSDPNSPTSAGTGQPRENQTNAPGPDGRRRRVHTATIRLRNVLS